MDPPGGPTIAPDRREVIRQLAVVGQVHFSVAVHAIYVCNGDLRLAARYLKTKGSDDTTEERIWTVDEDSHLRAGEDAMVIDPHKRYRSETHVEARKLFLGL